MWSKIQIATTWRTLKYWEKATFSSVSSLISSGADVNAREDSGYPVIILAVMGTASRDNPAGRDSTSVIEYLILAGADVNARSVCGSTALMTAISLKLPKVARLLIKSGADANPADPPYGQTPLMEATRVGAVDVVHALISAGADLEARDQSQMTAIMKASRKHQLGVLRVLIDAGADIHAQTPDGSSVIKNIVEDPGHSSDCVNALISAGAIMKKSDRFKTAFLIAAKKHQGETLRTLIANGANVNDVDERGNNALMLAIGSKRTQCAYGLSLIIEILLNAGIDYNARNQDGDRAVDIMRRLEWEPINNFGDDEDGEPIIPDDYVEQEARGVGALEKLSGN